MSGFLLVFTLCRRLFLEHLGDRRARPKLIAFRHRLLESRNIPVRIWRAATSGIAGGTGLGGHRRGRLRHHRAQPAVGLFPRSTKRGRVMAIFFCAIPGGLRVGLHRRWFGLMDVHFGWRMALLSSPAFPGLALAVLCLWMKDPPRGSQDHGSIGGGQSGDRHRPKAASKGKSLACGSTKAYLPAQLLKNKPYVFTVLGYAAYTFAMGGLAYWMPAFLERIRGIALGAQAIGAVSAPSS